MPRSPGPAGRLAELGQQLGPLFGRQALERRENSGEGILAFRARPPICGHVGLHVGVRAARNQHLAHCGLSLDLRALDEQRENNVISVRFHSFERAVREGEIKLRIKCPFLF